MPPKVLVVDDDQTIRTMVRGSLESDYALEEAADGADAIRLLEQGDFDVILLDRQLPKVSGIDVLRRIRSLGVTTPVVLITMAATAPNILEAVHAGVNDCLAKPFHAATLRYKLKLLLARIAAEECASSDDAEGSVFRECVDHLSGALADAFRTRIALTLRRGAIDDYKHARPLGEISVLTPLSGALEGPCLVSMSRDTALEIVGRIDGRNPRMIDRRTADALLRLAEVVFSKARSTPLRDLLLFGESEIFAGKTRVLNLPKGATLQYVSFQSDIGDITLQFGVKIHAPSPQVDE